MIQANDSKRHYVIGTAGHIDHGKTSMVKMLTGKDTDWLKEEKERGMTIDLGFAFLGDEITIIDVPGHEKFVRNMVAGVSTIDLVLMVVAADDGIMPQSREHLDILKLLQIKQGIVVVTKTDLVENEWLELVIEDIKQLVKATFLETAPIITVSNQTGEGIDRLKNAIADSIGRIQPRQDKGVFRMPVDRIFTIKGFGTITAGTVLSGSLCLDQMVELLPQRRRLRVRGIQIHEKMVNRVQIGDRAAVNLVGIDKQAVRRGDVLAEPGMFQPTRYFDGKFHLLQSAPRSLKHNDRVRLNIGTSEVIGRVSILDKDMIQPGEDAYIQYRLEKPVVADVGDRYVIRSYSPIHTLGGGSVIEVNPRRHKRFANEVLEKMNLLEKVGPEELVEQFLKQGGFRFFTLEELAKKSTMNQQLVIEIVEELKSSNQCVFYQEKGQRYFVHSKILEELKSAIVGAVEEFHRLNPTRSGINRLELKDKLDVRDSRLFIFAVEKLVKENRIKLYDQRVARADHQINVSDQ
ncbi:MAG TPA: selenocysteine-specific translation elongation factor, partial [bacterium]|nr:selenocysteine-specific translation elongation factor [bacterium]